MALRNAMSKAKPGSQILVSPGHYAEPLVIDKSVEVLAANRESGSKPVFQWAGTPGLTIRSGKAIVRGITFEYGATDHAGAQNGESHQFAIRATGGSLTLVGCEVSGGGMGLVITGKGSVALLRDCIVRETEQAAVICENSAAVTLEQCRLLAISGDGVRVFGDGNAILRRSIIKNCRSNGVVIAGKCQAGFESCNISENGKSGIRAEQLKEINGTASTGKGMLTVIGGQVDGNRNVGIAITKGFEAKIEGCSIFSNGDSEVEIGSGAAPVIKKCHIGSNQSQSSVRAKIGIHILAGGMGVAEDCNIERQSEFGVLGEKSGGFTLRGCRVHGSGGIGIGVLGGRGNIEQCEVFENRIGGVDLTGRSETSIKHCKIHDNPSENDRRPERMGTAPPFRDITTAYDHGAETNRYLLHTAYWGLRLTDGATGAMDDLDIFSNGGIGVVALSAAAPNMRNSRIYNHLQHGVNCGHSDGNFENVECYGNGNCGFLIQDRGNPTCVGCDFHDNGGKALAVEYKGLGAFKECKMRGGATAAVLVSTDSGPALVSCQIAEGFKGVSIERSSGGTLDYCDVTKNKNNGLDIKSGSNPKIRNCRIVENGWDGIWVDQGSKGSIEDTEVSGNGASGITVWTSSKPTVLRCKITNNKGDGIIVSDGSDPYFRSTTVANSAKEGVSISAKGLGRFEDCDILQSGLRPLGVLKGGNPSFLNCRIK